MKFGQNVPWLISAKVCDFDFPNSSSFMRSRVMKIDQQIFNLLTSK